MKNKAIWTGCALFCALIIWGCVEELRPVFQIGQAFVEGDIWGSVTRLD